MLELCLFRSAISFVFSMVALLGKGVTPLFGHRHNLNLLALRGVSGTLAMTTYYWCAVVIGTPSKSHDSPKLVVSTSCMEQTTTVWLTALHQAEVCNARSGMT